MPICLNCEIELPEGTVNCPHCGEECEQEVESNDGGILAGAWDDEGDALSFSEAEAEPDELPQVEPVVRDEPDELPQVEPVVRDEPDELPQVEPVATDLPNEMDELPMAGVPAGGGGDAGDADADDADDEAAKKKADRAKRKAEREAKKAAAADGEDGGSKRGKTDRKSRTSKREKGAGGKSGKRGQKGAEARPAKPKKDPTLSQDRKAVLMALFSWFIFVLLYGAAFAKGLIFPSANEGAAQANMANVMFAGLGLFAMLFLWAHLKMGRYISITTVVIALGVEGFFIYRGLENLPGFVGVGLFTLAQLLCLTGSGWFFRATFGFLLTLLGGALFCIPHYVDYQLQGPEAQSVRVRKLMAGEIAIDGTSTAEGGTRAETHEVWPEMIMVADKFDESETAVKEFAALLGLGFMEDQLTKPALRERIMIETVITHLWMVNAGYSPGEGKAPDPQKGVDGLLDALDFEQATKEKTDAWRAIRDQSIERMMPYVQRFMESAPTGGGTVGVAGEFYNVDIQLPPLAGWSR